MRVSTHEKILNDYATRHEDIINDLAWHLWEAADDRTKRKIAIVAPGGVGVRPTLKSLNPLVQR